jgi:RNA polymerase-binding transcription factor DksA
MKAKDREAYRRTLMELGQRLGGDLTSVSDDALRGAGGEASGGLSNAPLHLADLGTDNFEQEVAVSLLENTVQTLQAVRAALDRLDAGTFGKCQQCGKELPAARLKAIPYTPYCVDCARQVQAEAAARQPNQG